MNACRRPAYAANVINAFEEAAESRGSRHEHYLNSGDLEVASSVRRQLVGLLKPPTLTLKQIVLQIARMFLPPSIMSQSLASPVTSGACIILIT